jgi:hypothetical protein
MRKEYISPLPLPPPPPPSPALPAYSYAGPVPLPIPMFFFKPYSRPAFDHAISFIADKQGVTINEEGLEKLFERLDEHEMKLFAVVFWCFDTNPNSSFHVDTRRPTLNSGELFYYFQFIKDSMQKPCIWNDIFAQILRILINTKSLKVDSRQHTEAWEDALICLQNCWVQLLV